MNWSNCTAVKLTSKEGEPYWFRTCDIGGDIWKDGAHVVSFPKGGPIPLTGRAPLTAAHALVGVTNNSLDTWLLDGVNDAGLVGGLLALNEGTSVPAASPGLTGVVGMEVVTYLLATCANVEEVAAAAESLQVLNVGYGGTSVAATMHYMFLDGTGRCLVLECADPARLGRFSVYRETLGLLANSPPYPQQLDNLGWYLSQSPELRWGVEGEPIRSITLEGLTVEPDPEAPHLSRGEGLPGSYASCDRFLRAAMFKYLNHEGRDIPGAAMLPLGSNLMSPLFEPHSQGVYHYYHLDGAGRPVGSHESYTQYLVMYDPARRALYLRPYDTTAWTRVALDNCPAGEMCRHPLCREPLAGVVESREIKP